MSESDRPPPFVHRNLPRLLLEAREAVMQHTRPSLREHGLLAAWTLTLLGLTALCSFGFIRHARRAAARMAAE